MKLILASATLVTVASAASDSFSYDPDAKYNPDNWANLDMGDSPNQCAGMANSPIDITTSPCDEYADYTLNGQEWDIYQLDFQINNQEAKVGFPGSESMNTMNIPGWTDTFKLYQFRIHLSSEHTINDANYPMELHMVHQSAENDAQIAVLGLFVEPTAAESHPIFETLLEQWEMLHDCTALGCSVDEVETYALMRLDVDLEGKRLECKCSVDGVETHALYGLFSVDDNGKAVRTLECPGSAEVETHALWSANPEDAGLRRRLTGNDGVNPYDLVAEGSSYYTYEGSLTTPPCSEVVAWNMNDTPVQITPLQYSRITNLILNFVDPLTCIQGTIANPLTGSTSRPVQPLHGRDVVRVCPMDDGADSSMTVNDSEEETSAAAGIMAGGVMMSAIAMAFAVL